jgi:excisionase family DNA binding protein
MSNIVRAKDLSRYLKLSDSTIYKLASSGVLPGFRIGDSWRFDLDEIMTLIKKMKRGNSGRKIDRTGKDRRKNGRANQDNKSGG